MSTIINLVILNFSPESALDYELVKKSPTAAGAPEHVWRRCGSPNIWSCRPRYTSRYWDSRALPDTPRNPLASRADLFTISKLKCMNYFLLFGSLSARGPYKVLRRSSNALRWASKTASRRRRSGASSNSIRFRTGRRPRSPSRRSLRKRSKR